MNKTPLPEVTQADVDRVIQWLSDEHSGSRAVDRRMVLACLSFLQVRADFADAVIEHIEMETRDGGHMGLRDINEIAKAVVNSGLPKTGK